MRANTKVGRCEIVTAFNWAPWREGNGSVTRSGMYLYVFQSARVGIGVHTASDTVVIGYRYLQVKRPGRETGHLPHLMPRIMISRASPKCLNDPQRDNCLFASQLDSDLDGGDGWSSRPDHFTPVFTKLDHGSAPGKNSLARWVSNHES